MADKEEQVPPSSHGQSHSVLYNHTGPKRLVLFILVQLLVTINSNICHTSAHALSTDNLSMVEALSLYSGDESLPSLSLANELTNS